VICSAPAGLETLTGQKVRLIRRVALGCVMCVVAVREASS
jgi:hypothetical protein